MMVQVIGSIFVVMPSKLSESWDDKYQSSANKAPFIYIFPGRLDTPNSPPWNPIDHQYMQYQITEYSLIHNVHQIIQLCTLLTPKCSHSMMLDGLKLKSAANQTAGCRPDPHEAPINQ